MDALRTPESFVTHSNFDTPGGTIYYIPKVSPDALLVKDTLYDLVDDCIVAYMKYATEVGKGCPKGIHVDTLNLENSDKQKRNLNLHITGCKARAVFNLVPGSSKFVLSVFDTIHNHELELEEFKHFSNRERQLTYLEQVFIVKAASMNIGDSDAQMLISKMKNRKKHVEFCNVVSFDSTFKTNKYKMVFVPFTVIDNHKKGVTVAASLLENETTKSYIWH
ncbi:protein FAR1-related sequence 5 [Tanacetum coccineum]